MNEAKQEECGTNRRGQSKQPARRGQRVNQPAHASQSRRGHKAGNSDDKDDGGPSRSGPNKEDEVARPSQDVGEIEEDPAEQSRRREELPRLREEQRQR